MHTPRQEDKFLDDREELLEEQEAEESGEEVREKISAVDDLDDLEDLLLESVTTANAKKAKNQGRKLDASQLEALSRMAAFEEAAAWEGQLAVLHFIHTSCSCGSTNSRCSRLYELHQHRKSNAQKLTQVATSSLPTSRYDSIETVTFCDDCLNADQLSSVLGTAYPLLRSLGEEAVVTLSQEDLELRELELALEALEREEAKEAEEAKEIEAFQAAETEEETSNESV